MRSTKNRSRFKQNRSRSGGNIINRVFESAGPNGKVRGTPQQIIEKYNQFAQDAQLANNPIETQNFYQHAEYYTRLLSTAQRELELRNEKNEQQNNEKETLKRGQNNENDAENIKSKPQENTGKDAEDDRTDAA